MDEKFQKIVGYVLLVVVGLGALSIFSNAVSYVATTAVREISTVAVQVGDNQSVSQGQTLRGYTEGDWDSAGGYKVDGTTVIDGDGNVDAAITSTTGTFSTSLQVDTTDGDAVSGLQFGTCTIFAYATTISASSTAQVDCQSATNGSLSAISGVTSGDTILAGLASTTVAGYEGLDIQWVAASTTNGYITMKIYNGTGTTFTWASTASSSIPYLVLR